MSRFRVLIIDDEPVVATVLARQLGLLDADVQSAASAEAGIGLLKQGAFDLILVDVSMPGTTGFQALRSIKAVSQAAVFLISGHADDEFARDAILLGAAGLLSKPIEMATLEGILHALESPRSRAQQHTAGVVPDGAAGLSGS